MIKLTYLAANLCSYPIIAIWSLKIDFFNDNIYSIIFLTLTIKKENIPCKYLYCIVSLCQETQALGMIQIFLLLENMDYRWKSYQIILILLCDLWHDVKVV